MAQDVRIEEVQTPRDRMRFIRFPWHVYRDDPHWVPPLISERKAFLDPEENPSLQHIDLALFLAVGSNQGEE
ncbi:MAG TPA: GTP cyclohydrolase, partial [Anaerolineae bacterium]|nr:GTP cyclohydrolase [Anaerolineae bacterium]